MALSATAESGKTYRQRVMRPYNRDLSSAHSESRNLIGIQKNHLPFGFCFPKRNTIKRICITIFLINGVIKQNFTWLAINRLSFPKIFESFDFFVRCSTRHNDEGAVLVHGHRLPPLGHILLPNTSVRQQKVSRVDEEKDVRGRVIFFLSRWG